MDKNACSGTKNRAIGVIIISVATKLSRPVLASVALVRGGDVVPAGGVEVAYVPVEGWTFSGRVGARYVKERQPAYASPLTFGLGFSLDRVSIDYAFEPFVGPGAAHVLGLRLR